MIDTLDLKGFIVDDLEANKAFGVLFFEVCIFSNANCILPF